MENRFEIIEKKLNSKDKRVQNDAIQLVISLKNVKELTFLLNYLHRKKIKNAYPKVIHALGMSANSSAIEPLIGIYGKATPTKKKMILKSLYRLGAFQRHFSGVHLSKNLEQRMWALFFSSSSEKLKKIIALDKQSFQKEIDFAWKITKHWRK